VVVGTLQLDLLLHAPHSLKEKRGLVRQLVAKIRNRFPVSCAEVASQELWQRCGIGVAMVGQTEVEIQRIFSAIDELVAASGYAETIESFSDFAHY